MNKTGPYRLLVVESFELDNTSGHKDPVQIRPRPRQPYSPYMLLECSRRMVDTSVYPIGTLFKVWVRTKQKSGCKPHLYCNPRDEIRPVSKSTAYRLIAKMRRGEI